MSLFLFALINASLVAVIHAAPANKTGNGVALIMIEEAGCPYCVRWHNEIGAIYGNTDEGRFAPLTTHYIDEKAASSYKRVVFTPTFIVVAKGREIGRIVGYPGSNFFWPLLDEILSKVGFGDAPADLAQSQR